jgi:hypothetical protein
VTIAQKESPNAFLLIDNPSKQWRQILSHQELNYPTIP